jgi:hypothetical protein
MAPFLGTIVAYEALHAHPGETGHRGRLSGGPP